MQDGWNTNDCGSRFDSSETNLDPQMVSTVTADGLTDWSRTRGLKAVDKVSDAWQTAPKNLGNPEIHLGSVSRHL